MTHEEQLAEKINLILEDLREHFDAVQFLGTFEDDNGDTGFLSLGKGNWYARQGVAREFLTRDSAATNAHEIQKVIPPSHGDEGDNWKDEI